VVAVDDRGKERASDYAAAARPHLQQAPDAARSARSTGIRSLRPVAGRPALAHCEARSSELFGTSRSPGLYSNRARPGSASTRAPACPGVPDPPGARRRRQGDPGTVGPSLMRASQLGQELVKEAVTEKVGSARSASIAVGP